MKNKYHFIKPFFILLLLIGFHSVKAQTTNDGLIYVSPNTQFSVVNDFDNTTQGSFINDGETFIYSDYNNNGFVDYTAQTGYTRFEGSQVQELSGGTISYFYDVLFNNNSNDIASFELSSEISIANEVFFDNGIVKNDDNGGLIIFEENGIHTNTSNFSHVDGPVQKNGNSNFSFPIGDRQFFRYAAISAPESSNATFTAKYFFEDPDGLYPRSNTQGIISSINTNEYWEIRNNLTTNEKVFVTLSWDDSTTPSSITANPQSAIHIVRWDEVQELWIDEGGVVDAANNTVTTLTTLDEYGIFTLARVKENLLLPGNVVIYNAVTPNGDGKNDFFNIVNIQDLDNNRVEIYNRWGVQVFDTTNYNTNGNVFNGISNGRITLNNSDLLPTGTYFYVLSYDYNNGGATQRVRKSGFLYLTTD